MEIILPIGISGSGKSRYYKLEGLDKTHKLISSDEIRYNITGNISDQSRNDEVFKIIEDMINDCVNNNVDIYYDATNLNSRYRKKFVNKFKNNPNVKITYLLFPADIELSNERIRHDIEEHVNRSDVPYNVLERQMKLYKETIYSDFDGENVHKIIRL